ncbi:MAG: hypothetical protein JWM11_2163 [Planctomycetaceae bacterium]|nr:hypothetical protein [Planctomycetaceae bacterium]
MPDFIDDHQGFISQLRRRIGSVSAAAAALLTSYSVAESAQPIHRLLHTATSTSVEADRRSIVRPLIAPLVLKPNTGGPITILAGHRSHSSHSSHRSHTSGSFHSSHFSSSASVPRTQISRPAITKSYSPRSRDKESKTVTSAESEQTSPIPEQVEPRQERAPKQSDLDTVNDKQAEPKKEKPVPRPAVDYNDPKQRFRAHTFSEIDGKPKVTIEDLKTEKKKRVSEGDVVAGYHVIKIDHENHTVELRGDDKKTIIVNQ